MNQDDSETGNAATNAANGNKPVESLLHDVPLELTVELGRMSSRAGKGTGTAKVGGEVACVTDLLFVLV